MKDSILCSQYVRDCIICTPQEILQTTEKRYIAGPDDSSYMKGVVLSADSGHAVPDAKIVICFDKVELEVVTDNIGEYSRSFLLDGLVGLEIHHNAYRDFVANPVLRKGYMTYFDIMLVPV